MMITLLRSSEDDRFRFFDLGGLMRLDFGELVMTRDGSFTIRDGTLDELYHSEDGALYEAENLYVGSSGIFASGDASCCARILDVGLGLGYNAMMTLEAWLYNQSSQDVKILSLEHNSFLVKSLSSGTGPWQRSWPRHWLDWCRSLRYLDEVSLEATIELESGRTAIWHIHVGNACEFSNPFTQGFQFIWQDPFSPGKAPELWSEQWFNHLRNNSIPDCRLMTYSVARQVRDNLAAAGWNWEKINTPGTKKHWLKATLETHDL